MRFHICPSLYEILLVEVLYNTTSSTQVAGIEKRTFTLWIFSATIQLVFIVFRFLFISNKIIFIFFVFLDELLQRINNLVLPVGGGHSGGVHRLRP